jgi:hypothetical protein
LIVFELGPIDGTLSVSPSGICLCLSM